MENLLTKKKGIKKHQICVSLVDVLNCTLLQNKYHRMRSPECLHLIRYGVCPWEKNPLSLKFRLPKARQISNANTGAKGSHSQALNHVCHFLW